jgi:hypothetical protein
VGQADLDLLAADHDRPADRHPPGDDQELGQAGRPGGSGAAAAQPGTGLGRDGAGDGADQDPAGQDVGDRAVEAQGDALPGQRSPALTMWSPRLTLPDAFTVRSTSVTSPAAGGSGGGPAGCAPAAVRRARSRASRRDGRVLMRWPSFSISGYTPWLVKQREILSAR